MTLRESYLVPNATPGIQAETLTKDRHTRS